MAGCWEFPGGKIEPGETQRGALQREIEEELGVKVLAARRLISVGHEYGDRIVKLSVWRVLDYRRTIRNRDRQSLEWRHPDDLANVNMLPADKPVIMALRLPEIYVVTPPAETSVDRLCRNLRFVGANGLRLVQLRLPDTPCEELETIASAAAGVCEELGVKLLLNGDPNKISRLAAKVSAAGIHIPSRFLATLESRPLSSSRLVGASCHNAAELDRAALCGADFAVLGPVAETPTHRGTTVLEWGRFEALTSRSRLPVYAIGGMRREDIAAAFCAGGQGIAGISDLWPHIE